MNGNQEDTKRALRDAEAALEKALSDQVDLQEEVMSKVKQFAHDIKNPLTAMIGLTKLMKMGVTTPDKIQPNAEIIHQSATRILGLCDDMLLHTETALGDDKASIGSVDDDKIQDVNAAEIIGEVTSLYTEMAKERDINLSAKISENFPNISTVQGICIAH